MKALTIQQPWAWAIARSTKRIENRTWFTRYRGPLAIHAGKGRTWLVPGIRELQSMGILPQSAYEHFEHEDELGVFGAIVAVCDLVDCVPHDDVDGDQWACGPWCWILDNVHAFDRPIPCNGAQGLWEVQRELWGVRTNT